MKDYGRRHVFDIDMYATEKKISHNTFFYVSTGVPYPQKRTQLEQKFRSVSKSTAAFIPP
jgi:hypothetical protein